jgi:hypothetical protein
MKIFYYVHTGHRIGLDRFRRATTILRALNDDSITLLTSDFRIAHISKDFGIKDCVGLDVVRNIPQIAQHGDKLIFDSQEANPIMLDDMRQFFSSFIRLSDDKNDKKEAHELLISPYLEGKEICNTYAVDDKYFGDFEKTTKLSFFFGDDDYEKDLEKNLDFLRGFEPALQLGFYYFLDYEDSLKDKFKKTFEFEDYDEMITSSEILLTASPQAVLESLASGGKPIYFQREDYTNNFNKLFDTLNIPIIYNYDKNQLFVLLDTINNIKYQKIEKDSNKFTNFIKEFLNI